MRLQFAFLLLSATAFAETREEIRERLAPASAYPPFTIISASGKDVTVKWSISGEERATCVLQNLPGIGRPTEEEATTWLKSLNPGDAPSISVRHLNNGKLSPPKRHTLLIRSRVDEARSRAKTTTDPVEKVKVSTLVLNQVFARLMTAEEPNGKRSLFLNVTKCADGPVYLGTTTLKVASGDKALEIRLKDDEIHRRFGGLQACEDIIANVTDNLPLHSLIADADGTNAITFRLIGNDSHADVTVAGEGARALRHVLTIHYAE